MTTCTVLYIVLVFWAVAADRPPMTGDGVLYESTVITYSRPFHEGEIVSVYCNIDNNVETLRMVYHDAENNILFETGDIGGSNVKFRSYMYSDRNNSYLNCYYNSPKVWGTTLYRTNFVLDQGEGLGPVWVNGVQTTAVKGLYQIVYPCIDGEHFELICGTKGGQRLATAPQVSVQNFSVLCELEQTSYTCGTLGNLVNVKFVRDLYYTINTPRFGGLRRDNIVYEYTSAADEWTIHYKFTANDVLNLTCVCRVNNLNYVTFNWMYHGVIYGEPQTHYISTYNNIGKMNKILTLTDDDDGFTLQCQTGLKHTYTDEYYKASVILKLHLISNVSSTYGEVDVVPGHEDTKNDDSNWPITLVYILSGIVVIIFGCGAVVICYKKGIYKYHMSVTNIISRQDNIGRPGRESPTQCSNIMANNFYPQIDYGVTVENDLYETHMETQKKIKTKTSNYALTQSSSVRETGDKSH